MAKGEEIIIPGADPWIDEDLPVVSRRVAHIGVWRPAALNRHTWVGDTEVPEVRPLPVPASDNPFPQLGILPGYGRRLPSGESSEVEWERAGSHTLMPPRPAQKIVRPLYDPPSQNIRVSVGLHRSGVYQEIDFLRLRLKGAEQAPYQPFVRVRLVRAGCHRDAQAYPLPMLFGHVRHFGQDIIRIGRPDDRAHEYAPLAQRLAQPHHGPARIAFEDPFHWKSTAIDRKHHAFRHTFHGMLAESLQQIPKAEVRHDLHNRTDAGPDLRSRVLKRQELSRLALENRNVGHRLPQAPAALSQLTSQSLLTGWPGTRRLG
ncbi:hypothetical protein GCM10018779_01280 [Streptomyces griseocarneus]|nr:hypothetical protein GCM10018779_01280 [Streptomyces griseocarneus]